jgi:hypothetical protein
MRRVRPLPALLLLVLPLLAFTAPAQATDQHTFDPILSLRGDCSVSPLDEVPDPGECPGTPGIDHPPKPFANPCDTATDRHGDIYVTSPSQATPAKGRIDVFNSEGEYLTEIKDPNFPCSIAVDSEGNLYVAGSPGAELFTAKSFPPSKGVEYEAPVVVREAGECRVASVAVDPSDDHLFVGLGCLGADTIYEYGSAAEGNPLLAEHDSGGAAWRFKDVAVWGKNHDLYASGVSRSADPSKTDEPQYARAFIFDGADGHLKCEIDGSEVPGGFGFHFGKADVSVDQSNGDLYLADLGGGHAAVDQFDSECHFIGQIEHSFTPSTASETGGAGLAFDAPYEGQPGYDSPNQGELYVAQGQAAEEFHLYAFAPFIPPKPPAISDQQPAAVSDTEALLRGRVNPNGVDTTYHFQYISQADYEADGETYGAGTGTVPAPDADAGSNATPKAVSAPVSGLTPHTAYRFRLLATNHCHQDEPEVTCTTIGEGKPGEEGTDAAFTTYGPDPGIPDGRGYELVSPPDTGGLVPTLDVEKGALGARSGFPFPPVSPDGQSVVFGTEGGSLPGLPGNGFHDLYEARRGPGGWQTTSAGLTGAQSAEPSIGGVAADHSYSFWRADASGSVPPGYYLRGPAGIEPIPGPGGSLDANGLWIGPGGSQVLYADAGNIYQRSVAGGPSEALSILPGASTPSGGIYRGISADGSAVVFEHDNDLYVRLNASETQLVAEGNLLTNNSIAAPLFDGISAAGRRITYLRLNADLAKQRRTNPPSFNFSGGPHQGEIFSYDTETQQSTALGSGDEAVPVNVSADGSHVYFLSPAALSGDQQNSRGQAAIPPAAGQGTLAAGSAEVSGVSLEAGAFAPGMEISGAGIPLGTTVVGVDEAAGSLTVSQQATASGPVALSAFAENLYLWDAGTEAIHFIATPTQRDVYGEQAQTITGVAWDGLGLWTDYAARAPASGDTGPGADPSRSSADGRVLIFESRARLSAYDNAGHSEVYRYDAAADQLRCLSCTPTGVPPGGDALLQSPTATFLLAEPPVSAIGEVINLSADGQRAFFQSPEPLVVSDTDGLQDVYEWEAPGKGSCTEAGPAFQPQSGGCIYLISGPHSAAKDYLYGMTRDGSDVVFESGDLLSFEDRDRTPSLYDARVEGGFPEPPPPPGECLGEACQPAAEVPNDPTPASSSYQGAGNPGPGSGQGCPKGRVRHKGRCVKKHHRKHRHHRPKRRASYGSAQR